MPELRQNLATKEWVVVATDRAVRPDSLRRADGAAAASDRDPACPFCPGNEKQSEQIAAIGPEGTWKARVVRQKAPVLVADAPRVEPEGKLYRRLPGEGVHEVVIESPHHGRRWSQFSTEEAHAALQAYRSRFEALSENLKVSLTLLFKNQGRGAGTELEHPHAQVLGSSVVPAHIRHRMDEAQKHFEQNNECVFCRMIEEELAAKKRVVLENEKFVAFVPFAALSPFHVWVLPKRHTPAFHETTDDELAALAKLLPELLRKIDAGLNKPDFSFVIQSTPQDRGTTEAFHWYLSLVVRVGRPAGFEMGSGMFHNPVVPEDAAAFLRSVKA